MAHAYMSDPGYTGWKSRKLLDALGRGAKIITTDPRFAGKEVEYKPRELREAYPWTVKGGNFHSDRVRGTFCKPVHEDGREWNTK